MLVTHILTTYAQISQPGLDDNLTDFNTSIDPILPLAVYTAWKQKKCQHPHLQRHHGHHWDQTRPCHREHDPGVA